LVTFAVILLFLLGGFELVIAITEFFKCLGTRPRSRSQLQYLLGVRRTLRPALLYAGFALLQGQAFDARSR
jgi:hypothetical protein